MSERQECFNCKYWEANSRRKGIGECHRSAPIASVLKVFSKGGASEVEELVERRAWWPVTQLDCWCGDFKTKKGDP